MCNVINKTGEKRLTFFLPFLSAVSDFIDIEGPLHSLIFLPLLGSSAVSHQVKDRPIRTPFFSF